MFLKFLQACIYRRFLINAVDINGKFKLNATTNDILKIQKVDGSILYDALELIRVCMGPNVISTGLSSECCSGCI